jgi:aspartate racemase
VLNQTACARLGGSHAAHCVLYSFDFGEIEALFHAEKYEEIAALMISGARTLERAGVEIIIICSNTSHFWAATIGEAIDVPILSILDVVADALKGDGIDTVGLVGTRFTMEHGFYTGRLSGHHGLRVLTPVASERSEIDDIIFGELVRGVFSNQSRNRYLEIIEGLVDRGAGGVILGCTEIELLVPPDDVRHLVSAPLFPTTRLHAQAAFAWSIGEYPDAVPSVHVAGGSPRT